MINLLLFVTLRDNLDFENDSDFVESLLDVLEVTVRGDDLPHALKRLLQKIDRSGSGVVKGQRQVQKFAKVSKTDEWNV